MYSCADSALVYMFPGSTPFLMFVIEPVNKDSTIIGALMYNKLRGTCTLLDFLKYITMTPSLPNGIWDLHKMVSVNIEHL